MAKVRFAPSPTGRLHLGSGRTAVFNWLYARHTGGKFVLRIEDTDRARSKQEYTDSILADMKWLGMDYDEFYRQSERIEIYREYCEKLIAEGKAYRCDCTRDALVARVHEAAPDGDSDFGVRYDGYCRNRKVAAGKDAVVRLAIGGDRDIGISDVVKGKISVNTKELDDYVIWKSDDMPTYNFAVVIDDALAGIDTVIRGEDHITNTFKQIVLYEYLGFPLPKFAHLPIVMDKDHTKLSKRKASTFMADYRAKGILPSAVLNYIARLGWAFGNEEVFTVARLVEVFDIAKLSKSNAVYDEEKMVWLNGKHMKLVPMDELLLRFDEFLAEAGLPKAGKMADPSWLAFAVDACRGRNSTLRALYDELLNYAFPENPMDEAAKANWERLSSDKAALSAFREARKWLLGLTEYSELPGAEAELRAIAERNGAKFGDLAGLLRSVLAGRTASPDLVTAVKLLGTDVRVRLGKD